MPPQLSGVLPYRVLSRALPYRVRSEPTSSNANDDQDVDIEAVERVDDEISPATPVEKALAALHGLKTQWLEVPCRKAFLDAIEGYKFTGALRISKVVFLDDSFDGALKSVGQSKPDSGLSFVTLVIFLDIVDYRQSAY
jgi:hypothetical protein